MDLKALTWTPNSSDLNLIKHLWEALEQALAMKGPLQPTELNRSSSNTLGCVTARPPIGSVSMPQQVRPEGSTVGPPWFGLNSDRDASMMSWSLVALPWPFLSNFCSVSRWPWLCHQGYPDLDLKVICSNIRKLPQSCRTLFIKSVECPFVYPCMCKDLRKNTTNCWSTENIETAFPEKKGRKSFSETTLAGLQSDSHALWDDIRY